MFRFRASLTVILATLVCLHAAAQEQRFEPTWESVGVKNDAPEWLKDAKFGIYTHWGPQTHMGDIDVQNSIWYYDQMYKKGSPVFEYHRKTFGDQNKVGYKDIIDHFKAKDFNAEKWADIFYDAGARFAGMVVIHHDNVAMWDSRINPYNCVRYGPKRDITGELAKAYRAKGMHFLATFHSLGSWSHSFLESYAYDGKSAVELYNEPHKKSDTCSRSFLDRNHNQIREVVEKYQPDGIWFDYGLYNSFGEKDRLKLASFYYNWGAENKKDVVLIHKHGTKLPTGILNTERGRGGILLEKTWMNDESIGVRYWFRNVERQRIAGNFPGKYLTHLVIDLAAKNGTLLLNVAPDKHGIVSEDQMEVLEIMGKWLKKYGEAIYKTRPWQMDASAYGEGPLQRRFRGRLSGSNPQMREYSVYDIRFTRSKEAKTDDAIFMGKPEAGVPIRSMKVVNEDLLGECQWVGLGPVKVEVNDKGQPVVDVGNVEIGACEEVGYAISFPADAISYTAGKYKETQIDLSVDTAKITGKSIRLDVIDPDDGIRALRGWKNTDDHVSWEVKLPSAGIWVVHAVLKGPRPTSASVTLGDKTKTAAIISKGMNIRPATRDLGSFMIDKAGTYTLAIKPGAKKGGWNPFEIYSVTLRRVR